MQIQTVILNGAVAGGGATTTCSAVAVQFSREAWFWFKNTHATVAWGATQVAFEQSLDGGATWAAADQTNVANFNNYTAANTLAAGVTACVGVVPKIVGALTFGNVTHFRAKITGNAGGASSALVTVYVGSDLLYPANPFAGI